MSWLCEQMSLLEELDKSWFLFQKIAKSKTKQQFIAWITHVRHLYEELRAQQNWDPSSKKRKAILRLLRWFCLLKPAYPAFSCIWDSPGMFPLSSSIQCPTIYGFDLCLSGMDMWSIVATGYYQQEMSETFIILKLLPLIDVFVDVGANIGVYSVLAAKNCSSCSVFAFEPESQNFEKLRQSVRINNLEERVKAFRQPISSGCRRMKLFRCFAGSGGHTLCSSVALKTKGLMFNANEFEEVDSITLDNVQEKYFPQSLRTLIKIDVESYEYEVIQGAQKWFSSASAPIILIEIDPKKNNKRLVVRELKRFGYRIYPILRPNGRVLGKAMGCIHPRSPIDNYLALPPHAYSLINSVGWNIDVRIYTRTESLRSMVAFLKNSLDIIDSI